MTDTIEPRLASLPAKTAIPFRQLLAAGQLTEDVVTAVLDAGELAGDTTKLVAFAAGYLHLRQTGVPVHDVIEMAKQQNRRINLCWSANRWSDEHEKLSRVEALQRMAAENIRYPVTRYRKHLPKRFPGYVITTSRRLGMEGLRQRHCVASYHDRVQAGTCAIAAVFINRQRWTVELQLTGEKKSPLRIAQVKTRYNELPAASVRKAIHDALQIPLPAPGKTFEAPGEANHLYMENLRRLLPMLADHQIETVTVQFEGSGDSGSIESIEYTPDNDELRRRTVQHLHTEPFLDDGQWQTTVTPREATIDDAIESLTYDYLQETDVNWYDNDGGFGELVIDVAAGTVKLEVNVRYTEHTTEHCSERDIATGDDV
jgi:hypothetical protein